MNPELRAALEVVTGAIDDVTTVSGGSICQSFRLTSRDGAQYFLKTQQAGMAPMFTAEADGLAALAATGAVKVPAVTASGVVANQSYLLMEYLALQPAASITAAQLGRQLAALHRHGAASFGWHQDNFIGSSVQPNHKSADWPEFFRQRRLAYQLQLAERQGHTGSLQQRGARLLEVLPQFFSLLPEPSLLHGDLWAGNWGADAEQCAVIFDPAVYYGDREADIAMTRLFGGFPADFYAAYQDHWPLADGHETRADLYNLYHILNHLNLFGGAYARQALDTIERLLSCLR